MYFRAAISKYCLLLGQDEMVFPSVKPGTVLTLKLELKNGHPEDIRVEVTNPHPPFCVRYRNVKIAWVAHLHLIFLFCEILLSKY